MSARRTAVLAALALTLLAVGPVPARAGIGRPAADPPAVTVALTSVSPVSVTDGKTLTLHGTITAGQVGADGVHVEVDVGYPVSSRSVLTRDLGTAPDPDQTAPATPDVRETLTDCADCLAGHVTSIPAGGTVAFAVSVPLGTRLQESVVSAFPLLVRATGTAGDEVATVLGTAVSWLPYFPGSVGAPLRVSWVWPLDPAPALAADGTVAAAAFPASLGTGGAIGAGLAGTIAPAGTTAVGDQPGFAPVTYAVEPSLLGAADAVAHDGWRRTGDASGGKGRTASPDAAAFLSELRTATRGHGVLALPYADPDAAALVHAGLSSDLTTAISTGASDVEAALPDADVLTGVGWVPGDAVDQAELDAYATAGTTALVVPGGQLAVPDDAGSPTATAVTDLPTRGPTVRGLLTDPDLEALLADGGRDQPTAAMSTQRLLACSP